MLRSHRNPAGRFFLTLVLAVCMATGATAQTADKPARGGTMVASLGANPDHLNLAISSSVIVALPSQAMIEGLVRLDGDFAPQPALAEKWTVSPDSKTITFNLRRGVK